MRAPFDGTVLRKDAEVGEIVAPSSAGGALSRTAIVTMADLATLEVEVDVNEAYIARITNGQAARITLDAYPDTSFAATVRQVVPTADRQKATVLVKVAIDGQRPAHPARDGRARGFRARGAERRAGGRAAAVYVPAAAIVGRQGLAGRAGQGEVAIGHTGRAGWRPRRGEERPGRRRDRDRLAAARA